MVFERQYLIVEPKPGDMLVYKCEKCGEVVGKFFEFPEEYACYFRKQEDARQ
ncbi:MAG: hypothetical protein QXF61_03090 [Nitrososphaeria archaeon]